MKNKNIETRKIIKDGILDLVGFKLYCCVLEDKTRGFSGREMQEALNMVDEDDKETSGGRLVRYLNQKSLNTFLYKGKRLDHYDPIICYKGKKKFHIYDANLLADICIAFLELEREAIKQGKVLPTRQAKIVERSRIFLGAFAKTGIESLIDEVTGYQDERGKDELQKRWQKTLGLYVSDKPQEWKKTFPNTLYNEIHRIYNLPLPKGNKRAGFIGKLTNKYIYENLPDGVLDKLKEKTPKSEKGNRSQRFHQSLTPDLGIEDLKKTIYSIEAFYIISKDNEEFKKMEAKYRFQKKKLYASLNMEKEQVKEDFDKKFKALLNVPSPKKTK